MHFYEEVMLPFFMRQACSSKPYVELRKKLIPLATGKVLEVGMGSGENLSCYDPEKLDFVWGLEPSEGMRKQAKKNVERSPVEVKWLDLPGEKIPLEDCSVDTVVLTYTLCSIADWRLALQQMHRVLKPEGKLLFCEHGKAPDSNVQKWQDRLTPTWKKVVGGCHLNRPITSYLEETGFAIENLETFYMEGFPRFVGYIYLGQASKSPGNHTN
jgi:ubiquinone/menaquinone biosynthesis C-methylase UbiE